MMDENEELKKAYADTVAGGTGIMRGGKRVDPADFHKSPAEMERDAARAIARELAEVTTLARDAMWADDPAAGWREIIALLDAALTRAREAGIVDANGS